VGTDTPEALAGRRMLVNWTHGDYILGNVRLARAGDLSNRDVHTAHALSNAGGGQEERGEGLDECKAILLAWLHHSADLWRKCGTLRTHPIWWAADFAPALRTVAAGPACGSGRDDTATMRR